MYNTGKQSEHRRIAKASMFTESQDFAEATKAFLVRKCCPHGARKGAKKDVLLATKGRKKQGTLNAEIERHLAGEPTTDVPDNR